MSDFNPLNPNLDLSCKSLNQCLDGVQDDELMEAADRELSMLLEVIKALREDRERSQRALNDLLAHVTKKTDMLCDIRDTLKDASKHTNKLRDDQSRCRAAGALFALVIKKLLKKHFGIDIPL